MVTFKLIAQPVSRIIILIISEILRNLSASPYILGSHLTKLKEPRSLIETGKVSEDQKDNFNWVTRSCSLDDFKNAKKEACFPKSNKNSHMWASLPLVLMTHNIKLNLVLHREMIATLNPRITNIPDVASSQKSKLLAVLFAGLPF